MIRGAWTLVLAISGCGEPAHPRAQEQEEPAFRIYAADAVEPAIREAAALFAEREGVEVQTHFLKASTAIESMANREDGDVFIPATPRPLEAARQRGVLADDPARTVAYLSVAIAVRKGNPKGVRSLDDFLRADVAVGMGDPQVATVGDLARRILDGHPRGAEITARMAEKGSCCSTTFELLTGGRADAVLGWDCFDGWGPDEVEVIPLGPDIREHVEVPAAIVRFARDAARARRFVDLLLGEGREILARHGYRTVRPAGEFTVVGELPMPLAGSAAFWDGQHAYILGGDGPEGLTDAILRFDPATGRAEETRWRLPSPRKVVSVAWDGSRPYVFGGCTAPDVLTDEILVFDPSVDGLRAARSRLPSPRGRTAAVFDGRYVYVLGGNTGGFAPTGYLDEIVRFDPATESVEVLPARLPSPRASRIAAGWDGHAAYLFGGMIQGGKTDEIVRFGPAGGGVEVMPARLPAPWDGGVVLFDGERFLLCGGMTLEASEVATVWSCAAFVEPVAALPAARKGQSAVWTGERGWIFGGRSGETLSAEIVTYWPPRFVRFE